MLRIGLTGGIGSGKSTVAALFARHGTPIIDTDLIARELVQPGLPALKEIVDLFGSQILDVSGHLDRTRLGEQVFADAAKRQRLEAILHPRIRMTVQERLAALDAPYCIVVVPLLIESGFREIVDRVLVVDCPEAQQIARVRTRNQLSEAQILAILNAQMPRTERLQHADDVIANDRDLNALETEVAALHAYYLSLAAEPAT